MREMILKVWGTYTATETPSETMICQVERTGDTGQTTTSSLGTGSVLLSQQAI